MEKVSNSREYGDAVTVNVDVQNDFALPTGSLSVRNGEAVIAPLNRLNQWTRENGGQVVYTGDQHPCDTKHFQEFGGPWPVHCVAGTEGAKLHEDLEVLPGDIIAEKGTSTEDDGYSGWFAEPLEQQYQFVSSIINKRAWENIREQSNTLASEKRLAVLIGGLATDYCVKATVLDACQDARAAAHSADLGIDVILVTDAIQAVNLQPGDGDAAIAAMIKAGAIAMTTEEILRGGIVIDTSRLER